MLESGIYPAAITPFDAKGRTDMVSVAKLLAWFEAAGCKGAVLAGTNGEGPSLSAVEKRDLLKAAMPLRGKLELVLGIATCSLDEANWLCRQAHNYGAAAVLLMAPFYFREAGEEEVAEWFEAVMSSSPVPVIIYNFPKRSGFAISAEMLARLASHEKFAGAKDSSGEPSNIRAYKDAVGENLLFVGNETLLMEALKAGWTGSISGAANVLPQWLSQIVAEWNEGARESADTKFRLILPLIERLRLAPQPATNKALLHSHSVIDLPDARLPLSAADANLVDETSCLIRRTVGVEF